MLNYQRMQNGLNCPILAAWERAIARSGDRSGEGHLGRNIILLSDGTGASSLSASKSNVWRVFTTLDLGPDANSNYKQIAFYDDGVGISGFKVLRALGGGFGWGLSRNVREMYEFLCRHYEPDDKIYIFGFSRGAFTARVLAHFISICGILNRAKATPGKPKLPMQTDRGLKCGVKQAYKSYRRCYWDEAWLPQRWLGKLFRSVRNVLPGGWEVLPADAFIKQFSLPKPARPDHLIEFIGIWDTVDAVGLPVDELSDLLDKWVYPYKFPSQTFSKDVKRACHALAIDDERHTFHPVLWDESKPEDAARVKQVWFAGMHSSVGGGYPEDNLGYVTLDWMIGEVDATRNNGVGLSFNAQKLDVIKQRAEPVGKIYNSRRGAGVYYRYRPRYIADLCRQKMKRGRGDFFRRRKRIHIETPKIHHSVLARIADTKAGYAPLGLPPKFSVIDQNGREAPFAEPAFSGEPSPADPRTPEQRRVELLERTKDHVFWRIFIYFSLLLLTLTVVSMPFFRPPIPGWVPEDDWTSAISNGLAIVFEQLAGVIPDFANYWTDTLVQSPVFTVGFIVLFIGLFVWSYRVEGNLRELSEGALWHIKGNGSPRWERPRGWPTNISRWFRKRPFGRGIGWLSAHLVMPVLFAIISLYLIFGGGYRMLVHYPAVKDGVCTMALAEARALAAEAAAAAVAAAAAAGKPLPSLKSSTPGPAEPGKVGQEEVGPEKKPEKVFDTSDPCFETGIKLVEGRHYKVRLVGADDWNLDGSRIVNDPFCLGKYGPSFWRDNERPATFKGLRCIMTRYHPTYLGGLPSRRHVFVPWFTLLGEIEKDSGIVIPFNRTKFEFRAPASGRLYLYVNDAIDSLYLFENYCAPEAKCDCVRDWRCHYRNNLGSALVMYNAFDVPPGDIPEDWKGKPRIEIEELSDGG